MSTVSIVGSGNMGGALAQLVERAGGTVQTIGHGEAATVQGDVVVLAVPYPALSDVAATLGDQLRGKVVVDITNPVDFSTMSPVPVAAGSAAQELAAALPEARVVKAFNTHVAATLASGRAGQVPVSVCVAGDDDAAKKAVLDLVAASGGTGVDAGPLAGAGRLEGLGFLQISLAVSGQVPWDGGFVLA